MSGLPGNLAVILAIAMAIVSGLAFLITATGRRNLLNLGRKAYYLQIGLVGYAMIHLWYLFFGNDFSIKYVYDYSSTNLPFFYKLSALWAGQDGTYLLWVFVSLILGLFILKYAKQYTSLGMFFLAVVNMFLYVMLMTVSPFRQLDGVPPDGSGLNPLLQDPWMVIHPPIVFIGFAMAGVVFAIVMAALVKRDFKDWVKITFPYVTFTALALAMANVLGGYWAYKTLGWGGYWAWDPVENTSFIPWIIALAALHGMLIEKKTGALRRVNLLLAASMFLLSIYGTFLTRSGVLADFSVHSFVDLGTNFILITFALVYFLMTLGLSIYGFIKAGSKPMNYSVYSRQFILFVGMILMSALALIVLFWSSLPMLTTYLTDSPRAAEISTYNTFAFPLSIMIALFLTLTPFVKQSDYKPKKSGMMLPVSIIIPLLVSGGLFLFDLIDFSMAITLMLYLFAVIYYIASGINTTKMIIAYIGGILGVVVALRLGVQDINYLFFVAAASSAISAHVMMLRKFFSGGFRKAGGTIGHLGYGLMLLGILSSSAYSYGNKLILPRGTTNSLYDVKYTYEGLVGSIMDENNEIILTVNQNGSRIDTRPHYFYTPKMDGIMRRPHIEKGIFHDLYLSPQEIQEMLHTEQGLMIQKGQVEQIANYTISFTEFEIDAHSMGGGSGAMAVGVALEVTKDGKTEKIVPVLINSGGSVRSDPVSLFSDSLYTVKVDKIDASSGTAMLSIPGLIEAGAADRLILDVSYKPGINMLWLGTLIMFLGMGVSIYRRFKA